MADPRREADSVFVIHAHSRPGVLAKVAGLFYRRGLNIHTLTAGPAGEPELARIVVEVTGPRPDLVRVAAAIDNLVDVLSVALSEIETLHTPA